MKVLSLFDGIAGAYEALKRAGLPVSKYYASEIDKYAIAIAKYNHRDIIHLGDIRYIEVENLPEIDLLIGGSPCEDLSIAKPNRKGLDGEKSKLFFEYYRIFKELKPKYFILENVASMKKKDKETITELMGVEPILINSALVSAQQRKRLYWTNILVKGLPEDKGILLQDILETGYTERKKSLCLIATYYKASLKDYFEKSQRQLVFEDGKMRKLTPIECERLQTFPENYTKYGLFGNKVKQISNTQRYKVLGNSFTVDVIAYILKHIKEEK